MMKKIISKFNIIFLVFLYLQPFLDITSGILLHYNYSITISSIIRLSFMFLSILYLLFVVKNKKINIYLIVLLSYFMLFTGTVLISKGMPTITYEVKNLLTTYYFVIILITLFSLYKNNNFNIKHLFIIYTIYLLFVFVPNILGIGYDSYWHSKEGSVGWFLSANVVGSILSILLPIIIVNLKKIDIKLILLLIINLYVIFTIGTKVPVLSFILIMAINFLYCLVNLFKKGKLKIIATIFVAAIFILCSAVIIFPKTSFYKNIVIHINYLEKKDNGKLTASDMIDHFVFSQRLTFEENTRKAYKNSNALEKLFGIGYIENYGTDNISLKTVEIDYFDILYRHGPIGFIIFFIPLIYVIKYIKENFKLAGYKKLNYILTIILIFILALFQGHIFVTPANSIFVALILVLIAYNEKIRFTNELNPKSWTVYK